MQKIIDIFCALQYIRSGVEARWICHALPKEPTMVKNFEDLQALGRDHLDAALKVFGATSKGTQVIATEAANYWRKSFEQGTQALERMLGAKTLDRAVEVQQEYIKTAYEDFVAQATRFGALYADLAREVYKPFESYLTKVAPAR